MTPEYRLKNEGINAPAALSPKTAVLLLFDFVGFSARMGGVPSSHFHAPMPTLTIELLNPEARTILTGLEDAGFIAIGQVPGTLRFSMPQNFNAEDFRHQKTVDELAQEQCVNPIHDLDRLFGYGKDLWETENEWNEYMESIQTGRNERA